MIGAARHNTNTKVAAYGRRCRGTPMFPRPVLMVTDSGWRSKKNPEFSLSHESVLATSALADW